MPISKATAEGRKYYALAPQRLGRYLVVSLLLDAQADEAAAVAVLRQSLGQWRAAHQPERPRAQSQPELVLTDDGWPGDL